MGAVPKFLVAPARRRSHGLAFALVAQDLPAELLPYSSTAPPGGGAASLAARSTRTLLATLPGAPGPAGPAAPVGPLGALGPAPPCLPIIIDGIEICIDPSARRRRNGGGGGGDGEPPWWDLLDEETRRKLRELRRERRKRLRRPRAGRRRRPSEARPWKPKGCGTQQLWEGCNWPGGFICATSLRQARARRPGIKLAAPGQCPTPKTPEWKQTQGLLIKQRQELWQQMQDREPPKRRPPRIPRPGERPFGEGQPTPKEKADLINDACFFRNTCMQACGWPYGIWCGQFLKDRLAKGQKFVPTAQALCTERGGEACKGGAGSAWPPEGCIGPLQGDTRRGPKWWIQLVLLRGRQTLELPIEFWQKLRRREVKPEKEGLEGQEGGGLGAACPPTSIACYKTVWPGGMICRAGGCSANETTDESAAFHV